MENKENMSTTESLDLINRMIRTAQNSVEDDSFYFLLWGWLVFAACLSNFVLMKVGSSMPSIAWAILMPAGGIISFIYGKKQKDQQRVKTYIDSLMNYVLIAFLVCLFTVLFFMNHLGLSTYPMVMMVYGMWLFISGGAMKFQPIVIGGIINWVIAIPTFFLAFDLQLIALAVAVLLGYIIPGHMLKNKAQKN